MGSEQLKRKNRTKRDDGHLTCDVSQVAGECQEVEDVLSSTVGCI